MLTDFLPLETPCSDERWRKSQKAAALLRRFQAELDVSESWRKAVETRTLAPNVLKSLFRFMEHIGRYCPDIPFEDKVDTLERYFAERACESKVEMMADPNIAPATKEVLSSEDDEFIKTEAFPGYVSAQGTAESILGDLGGRMSFRQGSGYAVRSLVDDFCTLYLPRKLFARCSALSSFDCPSSLSHRAAA